MSACSVSNGRVVCLVLFTLAACSANAQDEPPAKSWKVFGQVVDETGKPVAGVEVFTNALPSAQQSSSKTNADGQFTLEIAQRASGRLVRAPGDTSER